MPNCQHERSNEPDDDVYFTPSDPDTDHRDTLPGPDTEMQEYPLGAMHPPGAPAPPGFVVPGDEAETEHRDTLPGDDAEMLLPGETEPEMIRRILREDMPGILTRWADERAASRERAEDAREGASMGRDGIPD